MLRRTIRCMSLEQLCFLSRGGITLSAAQIAAIVKAVGLTTFERFSSWNPPLLSPLLLGRPPFSATSAPTRN